MVFASLEFLTVFLPAFLLCYRLAPAGARNAVLLAGSWLFYGWWSPAFLLLFIALAGYGWGAGLALECVRERRWPLALLVAVPLAVLAWFKYANITVRTWSGLVQALGGAPVAWLPVALPIGLSFTVLQIVSYLVDVHRGRFAAERRAQDFAMYLAMFGHLVAGPIIRYGWIRTRLGLRAMRWRQFCAGARRFMLGMAMKVLVADTLAPVVQQVFASEHPGLADAWLGCLAYTLQLFYDFAGYSAMAIGLGLMLGFRFPENFRAPYLARNLADFWRRWHMSLSSWLRDYLYIPLGGSRQGRGRTGAALLVTMGLGGLWHGADSWNFLYWGLLQGLGLMAVHGFRARGGRLPAPLAHALTLLFVMLGWTLFRSPDLSAAARMYAGQFGLNGVPLGDALHGTLRLPVVLAYTLGIAGVAAPAMRRRLPRAWLALRTWGAAAGFVLACALLASRGSAPFLYFQF